jgi:CheY-like chemotaxis protein
MPPRILFVEDNVGDFDLMVEAFAEIGFAAISERAPDGIAALKRLEGTGVDPTLILLDLNLPKLNGADLLPRLKAMERLKDVPVVILTSSTAESDRRRCQSADAYFSKAATWPGCLELAKEIRRISEAQSPYRA